MSFRALPFVAVPMCLLVACAAAPSSSDGITGQESNYTSEGGADGNANAMESADGGASSNGTAAEVAPFTVADATVKPKLRFSIDGAAAVDAYEPEWTTVISGADRRFKLQGATPIAGGKPVFYVEFGRGAALIEKGTYDCSRMEAVALVIDTDGAKKLSVVDGAPQRACTVTIDEAVDFVPTEGVRPRSWRNVVGHVEATVGDRTNAASETKNVRATFAVSVIES